MQLPFEWVLKLASVPSHTVLNRTLAEGRRIISSVLAHIHETNLSIRRECGGLSNYLVDVCATGNSATGIMDKVNVVLTRVWGIFQTFSRCLRHRYQRNRFGGQSQCRSNNIIPKNVWAGDDRSTGSQRNSGARTPPGGSCSGTRSSSAGQSGVVDVQCLHVLPQRGSIP